MMSRTEYTSTYFLWRSFSAVSIGLIILGFTLSLVITVWDMVVCGALSVFGIKKDCPLVNADPGGNFFYRRDRLTCLLDLPAGYTFHIVKKRQP